MTDFIFLQAAELQKKGTPFVLVTLTSVRGSAPSNVGNKMLVTLEGLLEGTVGGGKVEARAIAFSQEILTSHAPQLQTETWNLQTDIGMTCGGEVSFLFEPFHSKPWKIAVFGAGHVSQALIRTLLTLNCQIDCFENREEWSQRLPSSPKLKCHPFEALDSYLSQASEINFFISITKGHATDVPLLEMVLKRFPKPIYVGVIGSDVKASKIKAELLEKGVAPASLEFLRCPVGLSIGTNDPAEIAISIAAEMLQVRDDILKT